MRSDAIGISEAYPALSGSADAGGSSRTNGSSFKEMCSDYLEEVSSLQKEAGDMAGKVATGEVDNLHGIVIALNEADVSFRLMMQVRNKLVSAYEEIMRMQV